MLTQYDIKTGVLELVPTEELDQTDPEVIDAAAEAASALISAAQRLEINVGPPTAAELADVAKAKFLSCKNARSASARIGRQNRRLQLVLVLFGHSTALNVMSGQIWQIRALSGRMALVSHDCT
jgi:hypothetical protein